MLDIPEPATIELSDLETRRGDRSVDNDQHDKIMGQESQSLTHLFHFTRNREGGGAEEGVVGEKEVEQPLSVNFEE